eukprot:CCRYP_015203-RA/>CCRYP_015203-RA protein AED:0.06 eAED:0.06 QI:102/1/1/1/1/1/5/260/574
MLHDRSQMNLRPNKPTTTTTIPTEQQQQQRRHAMRQPIPASTTSSDPPPIQPSPTATSLAYSMDTEVPPPPAYQFQRSERIDPHHSHGRPGSFATTEDSIDASLCSEMSYYDSYQGYSYQSGEGGANAAGGSTNGWARQEEGGRDATETVHRMHRDLLRLLSRPELFHEALEWEELVERGVEDPAAYLRASGDERSKHDDNGIKSFENEFDEDSDYPTSPGGAASENKQSERGDDSSNAMKHSANEDFSNVLSGNCNTSALKTNKNNEEEKKDYIPLAHHIFAADAEVVLPQALTASQLFGIERVTGIELEAAAGIAGLSMLFLRWLALMPEGDHENIIDPPGLTVMRIAGGRYRVTGAHRVVWRWMNKFSPASVFQTPTNVNKADTSTSTTEEGESPDTDFDFGDLVTMTIIDVFETDSDGKLLSYCPTFDNRAVHKTQEVTERIRKGASHLMERMDVVKRSPAGKSVNRAAGNFGKMAISVGSLVRHKIEEEIHKHQKSPRRHGASPGGGEAVEEDDVDTVGKNDHSLGPVLEIESSKEELSVETPNDNKSDEKLLPHIPRGVWKSNPLADS